MGDEFIGAYAWVFGFACGWLTCIYCAIRLTRQERRAAARFRGLCLQAWPMLRRLAHHEGNINQPAAILAEDIRRALFMKPGKGDDDG